MTVNDDYEEFYKSFLYRIQRQKERQQRTLTKEEASLDIPYVFEPCEKYFGDNPLWLVAKRAWKVFILGFKIYGPIHTLPVLIFKRKQLMQKYASNNLPYLNSVIVHLKRYQNYLKILPGHQHLLPYIRQYSS